jgi:uncharacterized protein YjbI with pentapeptide repeats
MQLTKCRFTAKYWDYESQAEVDFSCPDQDGSSSSGLCIFHDENYLLDKNKTKDIEEKLIAKIRSSATQKEALLCVGYRLGDIRIKECFTKPVYFSKATFSGEANFSEANFQGQVSFSGANFQRLTDFTLAKFSGPTNFSGANFQGPVYFCNATFSRKTDFYAVTFSGEIANFVAVTFSGPVDFRFVRFPILAFFGYAKFLDANFSSSIFSGQARFFCEFKGKTYFNYVLFEDGRKIQFGKGTEKLSKVSFMNTDITRVRFLETTQWGETDGFKVYEEYLLEQSLNCYFDWKNITTIYEHSDYFKDLLVRLGVESKGKLHFARNDETNFIELTSDSFHVNDDSADEPKAISSIPIKLEENSKKAILSIDGKNLYEFVVEKDKDKLKVYLPKISLASVLAVYRNLRENYEYRLRYDEAGKFFIKEMELKRKYRELLTNYGINPVKPNDWFRRNLSLTGVYYNLSRYGEDLLRPTLLGVVVVFLSTLFWLMQSNPIHEASFSHVIGFTQVGNVTHWSKAFERSFADFLPVLSLGGDIKVGIMDYIIKIVGGVLTFGFLAIALRRKFERKYTR